MKKISFIAAVIAIAASAVSCQKSELCNDKNLVNFTVNVDNAGKSGFTEDSTSGVYNPYWDENDEIGVFFAYDEAKSKADAVFKNTEPKGQKAVFTGEAEIETGGAKILYTFSPSSAFEKLYEKTNTIGLALNEVQYPLATTADPACDLLIGQPYGFTVPESNEVVINDLRFLRPMAVLRVNLKGTAIADEVVKSLKISHDSYVFTGRVALNWDLEEDSGYGDNVIKGWNVKYNDVTAVFDEEHNPEAIVKVNTENNSVYFVVNPDTVGASTDLVFDLETEGHSVHKVITLPADMVLLAGKVNTLNLTIKDTDVLKSYDIVIAETKNGTVEADKTVAVAGETVTLTIIPETGYVLDAIAVTGTSGKDVELVNYQFEMPEENVTVSATFKSSTDGGIYFYETFDGCNGKGGNDGEWSGSVASGTFSADNEGWDCSKEYGADKCAKFGTGSAKGSATTPAITLPASAGGVAELTFRAGAWDNSKEKTTLNVSVDDGSLSAGSVEMEIGAWKDFSLVISGVTKETVKITFEASQSSNNRFFLDDVVVKSYSSDPVEPVAVTGVTLDKTELTLAEEDEYTLTATVNPDNATDKTVTWSTSDEDVVMVDNGYLLAAGEGTAVITVTTNDGGFTATCTVTVEKKAETEYEGSGTETDPYTIEDACKLIDSLGSASSDEVCVKGTVYKIDTYFAQYNSLTYWIGSEDKPLQVYSGKNLNNTNFNSVNDLNIGDELVVKGQLKKYNAIYEFDKNNYIVSRKEAPKYEISFASMTNGSVTADVESAAAGREVSLTVTPDSGYKLSEIVVVTTPGGETVEVKGNKFIMPASNVTVSATFEKVGDEPVAKTYEHKFLKTTMSEKVSSYTAKFTNTCGDLTTTLTNFNNNQLGWDYVKCGSKNAASTGTIVTEQIPEPIKRVKLTIDATDAANVNSVKLYVASDSDFKDILEEISFTNAVGEQTVTISSAQSDCYYKIAVDCKKSKNGIFQTSQVVYTTSEND